MSELLDVVTLKKSREDFLKLREEPSLNRALQSIQAVTSILIMVSPEFVQTIGEIYEKIGANGVSELLSSLSPDLIRKIGFFNLLLLQIPQRENTGISSVELMVRQLRRTVQNRLAGINK